MADDIYDLPGNFISGGFGGMCALITGHPLDTIKLRLQTQPTAVTGISPIYSSMTDCARKMYLGEGNQVQPRTVSNAVMFSRGCAGFSYWSLAIGPDTVKSRLQTAPEGMYPNGARDVVREILKKDGVLGFFKGSAPVFLRAMPASAAQFVGFEIAMKILCQSS